MKISYLGTTVLLLDDGKDQLLFDAFFSRASMLKAVFGKLRTDPLLVNRMTERFSMDRLRGIFISHSHMDHVLDAPYLALKTGADIYGSRSALNVARGGNVPEKKLHAYEEAMEYSVGDYHIRILPSIHSKAHWYNDDLGQVIEKPLVQPARMRDYKEGGSFDFVVENGGKTYLIRPSFNYIPGQLDGINADILFLGIAGLSKADEETKIAFFKETIEKTAPKLVIPLHWDNFFSPLEEPGYSFPAVFENTEKSFFELAEYCGTHGVNCCVQLPLTTLDF